MGRQQRGPLGRVQRAGVVEQEHVTGLGEGVRHGAAPGASVAQRGVPLLGELVPHLLAHGPQPRQLARRRLQPAREGGRQAVDLVTDRERRGVAEHDVGVPDAGWRTRPSRAPNARWSTMTSSGATASTTRCTSRATPTGSQSRSERRARAWKVSVSTAPARVASKKPRRASSSPRRLVLGADHPGVRAATELEVGPLVPEAPHDAVGRRPGRDDDPLPGIPPGRRPAWRAGTGARRSRG